jgi:hypothetical protein
MKNGIAAFVILVTSGFACSHQQQKETKVAPSQAPAPSRTLPRTHPRPPSALVRRTSTVANGSSAFGQNASTLCLASLSAATCASILISTKLTSTQTRQRNSSAWGVA